MEADVSRRAPVAASFVPFAAAAALAWAAVIVDTSIDWTLYAIAAALLSLSCVLGALRARHVWHVRYGGTVTSLVFLAAVGVLRNSAGGINSGAGVVALMPLIYIALLGEGRRQLYVLLFATAIFYIAPILIVGPPAYPHSQYRAALLTVAVSAIIGVATQRLVRSVRHQAAEALGRERMLEQVNEVVRRLSSSSQARQDVCEAAMRIGQASVAALYEPVKGSSALRTTALVGAQGSPAEIPIQQRCAVTQAFRSGQARLVTERVESQIASHELWSASGKPESILYEPLMRGSEPVGVLIVGWPARIKPAGPRATVVALIAHEAAAVIDRADTLVELTDLAITDPLTGLPNRRAWETRLQQALDAGQQFTIAMLDLDHFKDFNDAHGHPAGDRLLKETAAAWREQLRIGDMLARLGGEEFGLLLLDCDRGSAIEVIERLRKLVSHEQTCSAGFAERRNGEPCEAVTARADTALYEAKASGRDRTCMSV